MNVDNLWDAIYKLGSIHDKDTKDFEEYANKLCDTFRFLRESNYIDQKKNELTDRGKSLFQNLYVLNEADYAVSMIKDDLENNPIVKLMYQVFYVKEKVSKENLSNLLNLHQITDSETIKKSLGKYLIFLNKFSIITYSQKTGFFKINELSGISKPIKRHFVDPDTPFSNILNLRKILRSCSGHLYWIDKHFRKEALEIIHDGLPSSGKLLKITIISTSDNATVSAISDFNLLKNELNAKGIVCEWFLIDDPTFKWHDRWIVAEGVCYNVPPVLSIIRGQRSELLKSEEIDLQPFLDHITSTVS